MNNFHLSEVPSQSEQIQVLVNILGQNMTMFLRLFQVLNVSLLELTGHLSCHLRVDKPVALFCITACQSLCKVGDVTHEPVRYKKKESILHGTNGWCSVSDPSATNRGGGYKLHWTRHFLRKRPSSDYCLRARAWR